jgi:hypothetical protein
MLTPAERYFYDRGRYGEIAAKVDACMAVHRRPCVGFGCDMDHECARHRLTEQVVERAPGLLARWRGSGPTEAAAILAALEKAR